MQTPRQHSLSRTGSSVRGCLGGLLLLGAILNASAQSFDDGRQAYLRQDYVQAWRIWSALAAQKDAASQFGLGTLYHEGAAVERDLAEATRWFTRAAEQGYAPAQFNLGNAYRRGDGVEQSDEIANRWWKKAADQEFAPAQYNLATQYFFGRGAPKDEAIALIYYRRAAENGHPKAGPVLERLERLSVLGAGNAISGGAPSETADRGSGEGEPRAVSGPTDVSTPALAPVSVPAPATEPAPGEAAPLKAMATGSGAATGATWVRLQNPAWFTVQLVSMGSEESAKAFIAKHTWHHHVSYVSVERKKKRFYSVIYGAFPNRRAAQQAAQSLSKSARGGGKPWVRKLAGLQVGGS